MKRGFLPMVLLALLCGCRTRDVAHLGTPEEPLLLIISNAHAKNLLPRDVEEMGASLSTLSGLTVKVRAAQSPQEGITAFEGNKADAGLLTLAEYLLAHANHGVNARLQLIRANGSREYRGDVVMRRGSDLRPGMNLTGRKIAYVDAASVSGFLLPAMLLSDHDLKAEFAGSHEAAVKRLLDGKVDLAAVYSGASHDERLEIYATTLTMPNEPFFTRNGLDPVLDAALVKALLAWVADPSQQALALRLTGITGLVATEDGPYSAAYATLRGAGRFVEDLVPGGRSLAWSNLSPIWGP